MLECESFDDFTDRVALVWVVRPDDDSFFGCTCICPSYHMCATCKDVIGVAWYGDLIPKRLELMMQQLGHQKKSGSTKTAGNCYEFE